jgi:hypothetical protein
MKIARIFVLLLALPALCFAQHTHSYVGHYLVPFPGPQVYRDPKTGTLIFVESDGNHVAAISAQGKLIWDRDPVKDAHAPYYRTANPQIVYVGPNSEAQFKGLKGDRSEFVFITLVNSQFGLVRISSGEFVLLGQN